MPPYRSGRRRSKRTISVVPVRLWIAGSKDSHPAHTLDVSAQGMNIAGCRGEFKVGDKIEVLSRQTHAQFRIAWITAREGSSESSIGCANFIPKVASKREDSSPHHRRVGKGEPGFAKNSWVGLSVESVRHCRWSPTRLPGAKCQPCRKPTCHRITAYCGRQRSTTSASFRLWDRRCPALEYTRMFCVRAPFVGAILYECDKRSPQRDVLARSQAVKTSADS